MDWRKSDKVEHRSIPNEVNVKSHLSLRIPASKSHHEPDMQATQVVCARSISCMLCRIERSDHDLRGIESFEFPPTLDRPSLQLVGLPSGSGTEFRYLVTFQHC